MSPQNLPHRVERPITPAELVQVTLRHKGKAFVWSIVVAAVAVGVLVAWPRKYESEAKLFVRLGRESVALDPTATTGATVQVQESRENQLNSARDMLRSRALLEAVVAKIGAETDSQESVGGRTKGASARSSTVSSKN